MRPGKAVALTLALVACTTSPTTPAASHVVAGDLTSVLPGDIQTLDPALAEHVYSIEQVLMLFEPLLRFDPLTSRPVPAAAESLPSASRDGLRYRITLREGLMYSDGVAVRAQDYVYGLARLCDPRFAGSYAFTVSVIVGCAEWQRLEASAAPDALAKARRHLLDEGLRAISERDIEIVLREPAAYFVSILGLWFAVPVRQYDIERIGPKWWADPATLVGNGPFVLKEWTPGERFVFVRNDRARAPAKVRSWTKLIVKEDAARLAAYRDGAVDFVQLTAAELAVVESDARLRTDVRKARDGCSQYLLLNPMRPPLDDINVRLALAKSIDRDAYVREMRPDAEASTTLIPPGQPGHDPGDNLQRFDPVEARRLLASARYSGDALALSIAHLDWQRDHKLWAPWLAKQWATHLGLAVTVKETAPEDWTRAIKRADTVPLIQFKGWCPDYPDQQNWLSTLFGSSSTQNIVQTYLSSEVDGLLRAADREADASARDALYVQAGRAITKDAPAIWLNSRLSFYLVRPHVRDLNAGGIWRPELVWIANQAR